MAASSNNANAPVDMICMACEDTTCNFKPMRWQRRPVGDEDVLIEMKYCGVCHSDLHVAADHMKAVGRNTSYPCVPGHELAGICVAVGSKVTKVKVGDQVGVGCMVDSCLECKECKAGHEQKCKKQVGTYNSKDHSGRAAGLTPGEKTKGGYCDKMVVNERFAIVIPQGYPLECAGPVLCSGITMYEPLKVHGAKEGTRVGVVGLGGLGVMGLKLAKALGCTVVAISRSLAKEKLAKDAGAEFVVASSDPESMKQHEHSLDLILNTIPSNHDWTQYQTLLVPKTGKQVMLGIQSGMIAAYIASSLPKLTEPTVVHSMIGGIKNTEEVLELCAKNKIYPEIEVVAASKLNEVYTALAASNDSGKRYVLDIAGTLNEKVFEEPETPAPTIPLEESGLSTWGVVKDVMRVLFVY